MERSNESKKMLGNTKHHVTTKSPMFFTVESSGSNLKRKQ